MFSFFKKKKIIPHIKLSGVIGNVGKFKQGIDFAGQEEIIKKAFSIKKAPAVAISINSPGGSPVQSHLIHDFIRLQAKKNNKKVIIFAEDVAASGGYLIACAGDEIYANQSSIVGSIGVIYSSFGFKDLINKIGVQRRVYTAGKNKSTLDPFLDEKEEDIERLKNIHPIGRTGNPEEVANLICWLSSDDASFVTGQVWTIDGGRMTKLSLPENKYND